MDIHASLAEASQHLLSAQSTAVLLIEDTAAHALLIQRALREGPWEVTHVTKGREALHVLAAGAAQIVLLDLSLPDRDGLDLVTEIHSEYPLVPIIVVTSQEDVKKSVIAMKNGAWDYVVKSESQAFKETISEAVQKAWVRRLDSAEEKLAAKCRVAELVKAERFDTIAKTIRMLCAEVNNPVSSLITFSEILKKKIRRTPAGAEGHDDELQLIEEIMKSAQQIAHAIQKLQSDARELE